MFQFTTTTVINENKDFTNKSKVLFEASNGVLKIKRHNNFKKENVLAIYKRPATDPKLAKVTFTIPGTLKAGFYRIALYVRLSGNNNSYYANDFVFKGKPFYIEFEVKQDNETASDVAARIVKNAKKYMLMVYENDLLKVSNAGAVLTIEGVDEYQLITRADLEIFNTEAGIETFRGYMGAFETLLEGTMVQQGEAGFGTYSHIMKDLRLPTAANTRWISIVQDERPIPGAKYNEYIIYYCVNRGIMGGDAVGDVTRSRTTHVFYVNTNVASEFENALKVVGSIITVVNGTVTPDLPTLPGDVDSINTTIAQMQATITQIQGNLSTANQNISTNAEDISEANQDIQTLQGTVGEHTTKISTIEDDIEALEGEVDAHDTKITQNQSNIGTLQTTVGGHGTRLSTAENNIGTLQSNVGTLTTNVGSVTGNVSTLQGTVSTVQNTVNDHGTRLTSAESDIDDLEGDVTTLQGTVSDYGTRLTQAESDIDQLQAGN